MKNKKIILIILLILISLLVISSLSVGILKMTGKSLNLIPNQLSSFDITVTPNTSGYGSVSLDWSNYNYADKNFKVYKSSDGTNYETIGIDYTTVKSVKVLNVYPQEEARQYAGWMQNWGKGIIQADQVAIENFNSNPAEYLYRTDNGWNYDVVVFGFWDCNGDKDLSYNASVQVENFIIAGKGVIFGHDTIVNNWFDHPNFRRLAPYCGVQIIDDAVLDPSNQVTILKKGLFTNYPYYIGEVGQTLTIPLAHTIGQVVTNGTSWLRFNSNGSTMGSYTAPSYLTTYNNCSIIQTGHSNGAATEDEQKILANLTFYMNQLLFNAYTTKDSSAQDLALPSAPAITQTGKNFNWSSYDNGSTYWYYVESYNKNDTTSAGLIDRSTTKNLNVTTGVSYYRYIMDDSPSTIVTSSNGTATSSTSLPVDPTYKYLHHQMEQQQAQHHYQ